MSKDATTPEETSGDMAADQAADEDNSLGYSTGLNAQPDEAEEDVAKGVADPGHAPA